MGAWRRRLLRIDLTARSWLVEELADEALHAYLGGRGLGAHLLRVSGRHTLAPLDPAAPLIFSTGPLTGTRAPTSSRTNCTALSPLTDTLFDSNSGGFFGIRLKKAGYDALWIEGRSDRPVVLAVDPDGVRFEDAGELRGGGTRATQAALAAREGPGAATLAIGPAGESGSLLANIAHGTRCFGRGGLGAALGSKGVKALTVRGDLPVEVADPERFAFVVGECRKWLAAHPITGKGLPQFGTAVLMNVINAVGALPARNFRDSEFAAAEALSGEALRDRLFQGHKGCPNCGIACGHKVRVDDREGEAPEFETLWALGVDLGVSDLEEVTRLNWLANDLGLDTVSAGATVAAARELFEAGHLGWDPLAAGAAGVARLLEEMAHGRGRGAELRHGSRHLGAAHGAPDVSMTSKGLELPAYDPRGCQGQGLAYATSNRGGCHLRAYMVAPEILATPKLIDRFAAAGKGGLTIVFQNLNAAVDSLVLCRFTSFALKDDYYARLVRTATGLDLDAQGLLTVGERIYNLEKLVNLERGFTRADDTLPRRLLEEPVAAGPSAGHVVDLEPMLDEYYR
ncbi:MAG: aldehyde ferredoxin oxidoreductase family protein, partial [Deferrisomatales bacterium]|nr:aldehyde ferredoxin oxidoreductase family protein [Deferrisomatales bacterium]